MGTIQIDGSTPKLTIGNATAEDATILFDGNAQDYHVGLDDSSDSLVIGLGSALGTTPAMTVNSSQVVTFAQNPVFPDGGVAIADLDIDGGTDIGAAIVDADLFIIDDGAGGTNRKMAASRIATYIGDNSPNCLVTLSSAQTLSNDTVTKVTFDTEVYDSDSAFASNKFTVPTGKDGKYAILLNLSLDTGADSNMNYAYGYIYKNGSNIRQAGIDLRANPGRRNFVSVFSVEDLSATDYIEAYAIINDTSGSPSVTSGTANSLFMLYKLV